MKTLTLLFILFGAASPLLAQHGLQGEYYNGTNFDYKVLTRTDPQINFSWRGRHPAPNVNIEYHSVRWTGKLRAPATGVYRFSARVDDGIRIWVGGKLIVDEWGLHDSGSFEGEVKLQAGQFYNLKIEYFNAMLEGEVQVYWQMPDELQRVPIEPNHLYLIPGTVRKPAVVPPKAVAVATPAPQVTSPSKSVAVTPKPKVPPLEKKPVVKTSAPVTPAPVEVKKETPEVIAYPVEKGQVMVLKNVSFEQSSYILLPTSYAALDPLVSFLQKNPSVKIEIAGHTDNVGDPRLNLALSENRAKVVSNYLIQKGIAEARIIAKGYGGARPIASNTFEAERARNRRVELIVH